MTVTPRRKSIRLQGFDYTTDGAYFVTLVTQTRECLFGEIIYDEMVLSEYGKIVVEEWERSAFIRDEIELGSYVVMPNHFHGIVHIFENKNPLLVVGAYGCGFGTPERSERCHAELTTGIRKGDRKDYIPPNVGAYGHTPLQKPFRSPSHSLGAMVRGFKSSATKRINILRGTPGVPLWQRNFHDRVIRNNDEYALVERYIQDNPIKWAIDKENKPTG